jgi:hypothetical protein
MQPKWIALGLFVAGLCLILGAGIPQLKHVAIGSGSQFGSNEQPTLM